MAQIATPSFLSWMGLAREVTSGTAATASFWMPLTTLTPADNVTYNEDKGLRGAPVDVYNEVPGVRSSTYDMAGDVFADSIGFPLAGILGDVQVTGSTSPFTTIMAALNTGTGQPPTYTITDYDGNVARQYPGAVWSDCSLSFTAEGLLQHSSKVTALASAVQVSPPSPSFTSVKPMAVWKGTASIGGTSNALITDGSIDLQRNVSIINTIQNTQSPAQIFVGPLMVSGKLTVVTDSGETEYGKYLNGTNSALDLKWTDTDSNSIELQMSSNIYTAATIDRSKDYTVQSITFKSLANTTDKGQSNGYSPLKAILKNAVASGTYK